MSESDDVSIHAPVTPETCFLFDASRIAEMKPIAFPINAPRGSLGD